jgi:hypothetical protein
MPMRPWFLRLAFWTLLLLFIGWDWRHALPVNLRLEPPLLAAGSGQAASGGHCAIVR